VQDDESVGKLEAPPCRLHMQDIPIQIRPCQRDDDGTVPVLSANRLDRARGPGCMERDGQIEWLLAIFSVGLRVDDDGVVPELS